MHDKTIDWQLVYAAIWRSHNAQLRAVVDIDPIVLEALIGIDQQKKALLDNTQRFIDKQPANNALLWGARGTGKSSLVKAMLNHYCHEGLRVIEVAKNDLHHLPEIVDEIRSLPFRFIVYCDDFSFKANESSYIALKTILDGSIEKSPDNVVLYATSNRRHLMPEHHSDNDGTEVAVDGELHYSDAVEEKISLADRFGLWLSFYQSNFQGYLEIVDSYFPCYQGDRDELHAAARLFAVSRSSRSGRTALQFYNSFK